MEVHKTQLRVLRVLRVGSVPGKGRGRESKPSQAWNMYTWYPQRIDIKVHIRISAVAVAVAVENPPC
jgi:hypothetical protein